MPIRAKKVVIAALAAIICLCGADVCFMGQQPDPRHPELGLRWVLPYTKDILCQCTKILFGGTNLEPFPGSKYFFYPEDYEDDPLSLVNNDDKEDIKRRLRCLDEDSTGCQSNYTPNIYAYQYVWPMIPEGVTSFRFRVRGSNDVHIGLSSTNADVADMYEIVLGGWGNSRSAIRLSMQGSEEVWPFTNGIFTDTEYREFHISFANDFIQVSRGGEDPFMSFQNPDSFVVNYIGITTGFGGEADWLFCGLDE